MVLGISTDLTLRGRRKKRVYCRARLWMFAVLYGVLVPVCQLRADDESLRGRQLFENCVPCHGAAGQGNQAASAPNIAGMSARYIEEQLQHFRSGARGAHFSDTEGLRMRPVAMSLLGDDDVHIVARFVASLPAVTHAPLLSGDAQAGRKRYALCGSCHGPDGGGNESIDAPRIAGVDDWYLFMQLTKFKTGVRGASPGDAQGRVMTSMAATLLDEKSMRDVVAYISTLKPGSMRKSSIENQR